MTHLGFFQDGQLYLTVIFPCHHWKIKNKNAHQDLEATGEKSMGFQVRSLDTETLPQLPPIYGLKICILVSSSRGKKMGKIVHTL